MDDTFDPHDSRLRSLLKALTYRTIGTIATFVISYVVTGEVFTALAIGSVEPFVKMIVYYLHERVWQLVPHGAVRKLARPTRSKRKSPDTDRS